VFLVRPRHIFVPKLYSSPVITGKTKLLGVIGYPIEHSLSPVMHNAALAALQKTQPELMFAYVPFAIKPEDLPAAVAGLRAISLQGFNVTLPHKQAMLPLLAEVTPLARIVGAVNTVWHTAEGWAGTNTDVLGFLAPSQCPDFGIWGGSSGCRCRSGGIGLCQGACGRA
jgi:shikimate dehydrogenase